ncbi:uncharacterized protein TRIVIDRAFT_53060 [Trichoderma virens Gv29-8]|uniref:Uncharacterized protein n=1 Tax=Hypocrea virens (strain Gv29-8 / FGSC 10586) TaxID=413071 RepID=G9MV19_HYPVG|nr:uncharacterized protein TRIVIDRAFT_53060 [Trichoderma virens Gv29-8]EHK21740.1 hypothetical protein TRIVIDRAFT_53060 [Trichoderma virens Gv29-8]
MRSSQALIAFLSATSWALPSNIKVNPKAVTSTTCTAPQIKINSHDINVALLSICGGIAGKIEQCQGNPSSRTGQSGDALLSLNATTPGQRINITKGRWERCMRAARAVCGDSPFTSTCIGGANDNKGNVNFSPAVQ